MPVMHIDTCTVHNKKVMWTIANESKNSSSQKNFSIIGKETKFFHPELKPDKDQKDRWLS